MKTLEVLNADLVIAQRPSDTRPRLYTRATLRKATKCAECSEPLLVGKDAFRPLDNGYARWARICLRCIGMGCRSKA